ncbi:MAG: AAA family ATPase [Prosthecobacter sp.]|uniref:AAA family ATPase n=1 Tax=Prosthecobacter sp. TaxID=1965333 RepID=UPI0019DD56E4|nr:AAA family ATPase [Prosthecobacter sp.]MBE2285333.1 AAA family ATPase [Prosthecobacter sp.]
MSKPKPLTAIQLEGFRSIRKLPELALNSGLNVLIGGNGAGKSNFISFFQMLGAMMDPNVGLQHYIAEKGGADALLFRGVETTSEIRARFKFNRNTYELVLQPADDGRLFFGREKASLDGISGKVSNYEHGKGHFESWLPKVGAFPAGEQFTKEALSDWRVYHFHNTSRTAALMRSQNAVDNERLWADAGNIAAFLLRLRKEHEDHYKRIILHIQQAAPFFGDFHLKPDNNGQVQLLWTERYSQKLYYPHQLSDGSIRFICLAALLLQPEPPSTIIIDEPELGLHPYAITVLAGMFRLAEEKCQLIVSTQSSPLVDHLQLQDLIVVDRVNGETTLSRPDAESLKVWMEEYSVGELWDKNLIGGMPQP